MTLLCENTIGRSNISSAAKNRVIMVLSRLRWLPQTEREPKRMSNGDLAAAAATWNEPGKNIEVTNADIHDGVPADQFVERADDYVAQIFGHFSYVSVPQEARILGTDVPLPYA